MLTSFVEFVSSQKCNKKSLVDKKSLILGTIKDMLGQGVFKMECKYLLPSAVQLYH